MCRSLPNERLERATRYGFAGIVRTAFGGGGGWLRYSITAHAAMIVSSTTIVARMIRARLGCGALRSGALTSCYSESVSMRSASAKSRSVRPPLVCVDRMSRTLL